MSAHSPTPHVNVPSNSAGKVLVTERAQNKCERCATKNHEIDNLRRLLANVSERLGKLKS